MNEKVETTEQCGKNGKVKKEETNNGSLSNFSFKFPPVFWRLRSSSISLFSSFVWCIFFLLHILISLISPCGSLSSFTLQKLLRALRYSFFLLFFILSFLPL
jgi:hypothetical protein